MLGSTHGTLTTHSRLARVVACGEQRPHTVHGISEPQSGGGGQGTGAVDRDVSGRPLQAPVPDLDRFFRPESVAVVGASDSEGRPTPASPAS